ncbi:hypothetical protein ACSBR1_043215 [Camellia fascicularis]
MASQNSSMSSSKSPSSSTRTCLCSPTNHPGSFRCSLHRSSGRHSGKSTAHINRHDSSSKMTMSKSSLLKAFLKQTINPSNHDQERRKDFHPRPTRFAVLNNSPGNGVAVS